MTFLQKTVPERKLVRIQEKGQVTLPSKVRKKLGLKKGDLVNVMETEEGLLISPQEVVASKALDIIGKVLNEKGISLEELIVSGRQNRSNLIEKKYGIRSNKDK